MAQDDRALEKKRNIAQGMLFLPFFPSLKICLKGDLLLLSSAGPCHRPSLTHRGRLRSASALH